ncbi:MAG: FAD-dependent oxidoreductase [Thermoguttaceae bacterium]
MKTQLVVIGGGPGGYAAAFLAADLGMKVTLVEQDAKLGGTCLLRGCIPAKALLHVAKTMADAQHLADWGVSFASPKIEVAVMRDRKEKAIGNLTAGLKQIAAKRNVQVIRAKAAFEDSNTLKLEGQGDKPLDDDHLRFEHCIDVPETLLVVGGGYIGLEMGTVYAALGSKVTVVELTDGLLPGVDRDLVKPLHKNLEGRFAAIHLNTKVAGLKDLKDEIEVALEGNVEQKSQRFSRVLVSVGRKPNSAGLGLEKTKVQVGPRGFIVVDNRGKTHDANIFAIGDVAGEPMLAHKAAHEGKAAVEVLAGHPVTFEPRAIPAVVFTDPEIAWAGLTETQAKQQGRNVTVAMFPWAASGRAQAIGRTEGLTKWLIDPETERVLGCGIVGYAAGDLIAEAVLAIEMGASARDVVETIHPHPTFSETLGAAAEVFYGTATDIYRPRKL